MYMYVYSTCLEMADINSITKPLHKPQARKATTMCVEKI